MENNKTNELWEKIKLNSFFPAHSNDYFVMHNGGTANTITSEGRTQMSKVMENTCKLAKDMGYKIIVNGKEY